MAEDGLVTSFQTKPNFDGELDMGVIGSMGIYIFNKDDLLEQLIKDSHNIDSSHDFTREIIPEMVKTHGVYCYSFLDKQTGELSYWRDVGTLDSYWKANMDLLKHPEQLQLADDDWLIHSEPTRGAPTQVRSSAAHDIARISNSILTNGCIISSSYIEDTIISSNVSVSHSCKIIGSVIHPNVSISQNCDITKAVIGNGCFLPDGIVIGKNTNDDRKKFRVSEGGVVLVTSEMLGQKPITT